MRMSALLHLEKTNPITKFQLSRINREGNVVKDAHVKIDKIFQNLNFYKKLYHIISTTSDQNLMIYGSLDSFRQIAYNRSVFTSLGLTDQKFYANV